MVDQYLAATDGMFAAHHRSDVLLWYRLGKLAFGAHQLALVCTPRIAWPLGLCLYSYAQHLSLCLSLSLCVYVLLCLCLCVYVRVCVLYRRGTH